MGTGHALRDAFERTLRGDGQVHDLHMEIDLPSGRHPIAVSARALRPPIGREMLLISVKPPETATAT